MVEVSQKKLVIPQDCALQLLFNVRFLSRVLVEPAVMVVNQLCLSPVLCSCIKVEAVSFSVCLFQYAHLFLLRVVLCGLEKAQ